MEKLTLVLGASPNPARYSYKAIQSLRKRGFPVIAVGLRDTMAGDVQILKGKPEHSRIHTVGLYLGPKNQVEYYDYILSLKPCRIIFNPGTWNPELAKLANTNGIEVVDDCMLAMLSCGQF